MDISSKPTSRLDLVAATTNDPAVLEAIRLITRTAFLVDPATGIRIAGDIPVELLMVEALLARNAMDHLHVATQGGQLVAYVLYTRGDLTGNPGIHVQGLTIMGVLPQRQRQGIGTKLLEWSVQQMKEKCDALFVLGHPEFYGRAGFVACQTLGLSFPFPAPVEACRVAVLSERRLAPGIVSYHPIVHEFF